MNPLSIEYEMVIFGAGKFGFPAVRYSCIGDDIDIGGDWYPVTSILTSGEIIGQNRLTNGTKIIGYVR